MIDREANVNNTFENKRSKTAVSFALETNPSAAACVSVDGANEKLAVTFHRTRTEKQGQNPPTPTSMYAL